MSLSGIISQLVVLIAAVPTVGQVYGYDRIAVMDDQVEAVFGYTDTSASRGWTIRAWMLDRLTTEEILLTNVQTQARHTLRLQGYWEVNDLVGSRAAFRTVTEAIRTVLRGTTSLGADAELVEPPVVVEDGIAVLGGETYVVHAVAIHLVAQELIFL